jgi:hypothetical protein
MRWWRCVVAGERVIGVVAGEQDNENAVVEWITQGRMMTMHFFRKLMMMMLLDRLAITHLSWACTMGLLQQPEQKFTVFVIF